MPFCRLVFFFNVVYVYRGLGVYSVYAVVFRMVMVSPETAKSDTAPCDHIPVSLSVSLFCIDHGVAQESQRPLQRNEARGGSI